MDGVSAEDIRVYSSNDTKCPSCGGRLVFEPVEQMLKCGFCGNTYTPEKIELLQQLPEIDTGAADENEDDKCEIVCDSCGSVLIADKNTAATFCSFFEFLTRPVRKLSARRHDSYIDLLNETNMVVGPRPSADTYYDSKARIKFENAEVFSNSEM